MQNNNKVATACSRFLKFFVMFFLDLVDPQELRPRPLHNKETLILEVNLKFFQIRLFKCRHNKYAHQLYLFLSLIRIHLFKSLSSFVNNKTHNIV